MKIRVKVKVTEWCPTLCDPMDYTVHGILQARILEWVTFLFSRGSAQSRDQPRSPALQADSLPAEPQGRPKHTGVGSLSLLQWIFLTQELNQGPSTAGRFFTKWVIKPQLYCYDTCWFITSLLKRAHGLIDAGAPFGCSNKDLLFSSSAMSTFCDPMDCSTPGFPVLHYHLEFAQTHIHSIDNAIQLSHPLLPPSSCPLSFPASVAFAMSWLFTSGGQNIGASASASALPFMIRGAPVVPLCSRENKAIPSVLLPKLIHPCTSKYCVIIKALPFLILYLLSYPIPDFIELKLKLVFQFNEQEIPHVFF